MKRLRHPINSIREPFGKAGLIVGVIALVFAMLGGAYAAGALSGKQKKEVEKIAKKFAGKPGAPGANGTNGSPGPAGTNGTGSPGSPGVNGKSVVTSAAPVGSGAGKCETSNGTKFEVEGSGSSSVVCNGKNGTTGFTETLPTGKTEKGTWGAAGVPSKVVGGFIEAVYAPISFVIPLATAPTPIVVGLEEVEPGVFEPEPTPAGCLGNVENPGAEKGNLCAFVGAPLLTENFGPSPVFDPATGTEGAGTAGALLLLLPKTAEKAVAASGTWAVTAP